MQESELPFHVMVQLLYGMFHCIHTAIYSFQNFEYIAEIPTTNLLQKEAFSIKDIVTENI